MSLVARGAAIAGLLGVVFNVAAVVVVSVGDVGSAYRIDELPRWVIQAGANPTASHASSLLFAAGCAAIAVFAVGLGRRRPSLRGAGTVLLVVGSALNVVGSLAVIASTHLHLVACASWECVEQAIFWFRRAIELDAAFNFLLGAGLIVIGRAARGQPEIPARLPLLTIIAGVLTLPVALQFVSPLAARWLAVAGPLWLFVLLWWANALRERRS